MSGAVIIAKCDQGPDFQPQILRRLRMIVFLKFVVDNCAVLALNHENRLLDLNAFDFIREDREWIEAELLQVTEALWMNNSRITIGGKLKSLSFDEKGFFKL